ncbi:hypothetical protein BU16DRAFT_71645 [Lophium mytilinum]|uniref:T6SS Phospholipase effector Tle1-like catalytic domain-containing protein n=1 Tax=Lophium mytilinum TaxID=390894 RepID=A0A6A6QKY2_9PEZI|nr:hypothetical protein BU16DRAFT_71645 [Lophium mytilinum]
MCGNIENVFHALSLNEMRGDFAPILYTNPLSTQHLEQVWFPGFHSDVGGGENRFSNQIPDLTLQWMVRRLTGHVRYFDLQALRGLCHYSADIGQAEQFQNTIQWGKWYWVYKIRAKQERQEYLSSLHLADLGGTPTRNIVLEPVTAAEREWLPDHETWLLWQQQTTRAMETNERMHWIAKEYKENGGAVVTAAFRANKQLNATEPFANARRIVTGNQAYWSFTTRKVTMYETLRENLVIETLQDGSEIVYVV